jgi:hypothetical protein
MADPYCPRVHEKRSVMTTLDDQAESAGGSGGGRSKLWAHGRAWFCRVAGLVPDKRSRWSWKQRVKKLELDEADTFGTLAAALDMRCDREPESASVLRVCSAALRYLRDVVAGRDESESESRLRLAAIAWIQQGMSEAEDAE